MFTKPSIQWRVITFKNSCDRIYGLNKLMIRRVNSIITWLVRNISRHMDHIIWFIWHNLQGMICLWWERFNQVTEWWSSWCRKRLTVIWASIHATRQHMLKLFCNNSDYWSYVHTLWAQSLTFELKLYVWKVFENISITPH